MSTTLLFTAPALTDLAATVNAEHAACEAAVRSALKHARLCGEALLRAKDIIKHGEFEAWVKANCRVSPRQARNYMTIARNWEKIAALSPNRKRASEMSLEDLSVRAALRLLSDDSGKGLVYVDRFCPSCGERMVITSSRFVTCPACWDCRLYIRPDAAILTTSESVVVGEVKVRNIFRGLADPMQQAEIAVSVLSMLWDDAIPEVIRLLTVARTTQDRRRAREVLGKLGVRS